MTKSWRVLQQFPMNIESSRCPSPYTIDSIVLIVFRLNCIHRTNSTAEKSPKVSLTWFVYIFVLIITQEGINSTTDCLDARQAIYLRETRNLLWSDVTLPLEHSISLSAPSTSIIVLWPLCWMKKVRVHKRARTHASKSVAMSWEKGESLLMWIMIMRQGEATILVGTIEDAVSMASPFIPSLARRCFSPCWRFVWHFVSASIYISTSPVVAIATIPMVRQIFGPWWLDAPMASASNSRCNSLGRDTTCSFSVGTRWNWREPRRRYSRNCHPLSNM